MPRSAEEIARLANALIVRCANGHVLIQWTSHRDKPVPCPVCGRVIESSTEKS